MRPNTTAGVAACLLAAGGLAAEQAPLTAVVSPMGEITIRQGRREVGRLSPGLFEAGWRQAALGAAPATSAPPPAGVRHGVLRLADGGAVDSEVAVETAENRLTLRYRLTPRVAVTLNSLHVSLDLPESVAAGGTFAVDGRTNALPVQAGEPHLHAGQASDVRLLTASGADLALHTEAPASVLVQDNRRWGPSFSVRIGALAAESQPWPAGKPLSLTLTLSSPGGVQAEFDEPVTIAAGRDWVPLPVELDIVPGSALDFSGFGQLDPPAGRRGPVIVGTNGGFAFRDDPARPRRFYGVNLCFTAHYLERAEADRLAERLMRLGYNTVRFHHFDGQLADRAGGQSTALSAVELDKLDYLFAALKQRGIYITIDLFISRKVFAAEVFDGAAGDLPGDEFKMLVPVNERAFANWQSFARNLLTHVNPHTGLRWADDPALGWISMINEGNPANFIGRLSDRTRAEWQKAWDRWLKAQYADRAALAAAWGREPGGDPAAGGMTLARGDGAQARDFDRFLAETERGMMRRMRAFIRGELGCKALLTNMNGWNNNRHSQLARDEYDYVDDHFYVDHPEFLGKPWQLPSRCPNTSPVAAGAPGGRYTAFTRVFGKPFTISEYNYSGPGRFRGVGGILTGCMGAVQGWDVIWRFAYSHSRDSVIGARPAGYFDVASDPLNQCAERAGLCLFLRGDMQAAAHRVAIGLGGDPPAGPLAPAWNQLALVTRVGTLPAGQPAADLVVAADEAYAAKAGEGLLNRIRRAGWLRDGNATDLAALRSQSEDGALTVDAPRNVMTVATPRTAGCFAPAGETVQAGAVRVSIEDTDATVWVSSLDGADISGSRRLLVTHLTDLQNTGARFAERDRRTLLDWGRLPHLVRDGRATVVIARDRTGKATVHTLATSGRRTGVVSAEWQGDRLSIPLRVAVPEGARLTYEVVFGE